MRDTVFKDRLDRALREDPRDAQDIAKAAGVSPGDVSRWRNGKQQPTQSSLEALVKEMRVSGHWLLTGEGPMYRDQAEGLRLQVIGRIADGKISPRTLRKAEELHRLESRGATAEEIAKSMAKIRGSESNEAAQS